MTTAQIPSCSTRTSDRSATRTKALILVLSDPKTGSEEALGRLFNALAAAYDFKQNGDDVTVLFNGTGTRWIQDDPAHPTGGTGRYWDFAAEKWIEAPMAYPLRAEFLDYWPKNPRR